MKLSKSILLLALGLISFNISVFADTTSTEETNPSDQENVTTTNPSKSIVASDPWRVLKPYQRANWPEKATDLLSLWQSLAALVEDWKLEFNENQFELDNSYWTNDEIDTELQYYQSELSFYKARIAEMEATPENERDEYFEDDLSYYKGDVRFYEGEVVYLQELKTKNNIIEARQELLLGLIDEGESLLEELEREVYYVSDENKRSHDFRVVLSIAFCVLVLGLIMGFFFIATKRPNIADAIFAGPSGIQFITLFLLVIALVLFGLTDILEGKELAALLGSISGYILGRGLSMGQPGNNGDSDASS